MIVNILNGFFRLEWNLIFQQSLHHHSCIIRCPVKNHHIRMRNAFLFCLSNLIDQILTLFFCILYFLYMDTGTLITGRNQLLLIASAVIGNNPKSSIHNISAGSVIHIQQYRLCLRIILTKTKHDLRTCSPEMIN